MTPIDKGAENLLKLKVVMDENKRLRRYIERMENNRDQSGSEGANDDEDDTDDRSNDNESGN